MADVKQQIEALDEFLATSSAEISTPLAESIVLFNMLFPLAHTIHSYLYSFVSTDVRNTTARKKTSEFNQLEVQMEVDARNAVARVGGETWSQARASDCS